MTRGGTGGGIRVGVQLERSQRLEGTTGFAAQLGLEGGQAAARAELAAMLVHHAQGHQVVGLQHVGLDVGAFDVELGGLAHQFQQRVHQVALAKGFGLGECVCEAGGGFGQRHQP